MQEEALAVISNSLMRLKKPCKIRILEVKYYL